MAHSSIAFRASALLLLLAPYRKITLIERKHIVIATALVAIVICRLLPVSYFQGLDDLIGRPGDAVLLLAVIILLVTPNLWFHPRVGGAQPGCGIEPAEAILENHLRLDQAIDKKLNDVIGDTESSALAIIEQVRHLHDTASRLITYLDGSSLKAGDFAKEIVDSVAHLVEIGAFIAQLPEKMRRDLQCVHSVANEIKELGKLVEAVKLISMQSHLLAINAAIEASRAGKSGAAFRVVANEVRTLASDSGAVATRISEGLSRARQTVEGGIASSIAESTQQLDAVSLAAASIQKLQNNFEDMSQYYKTRFLVVTKHNEDLAKDIADVLGQIQYQDVVRQCIERIRFAMGQRNSLFQDAVGMADQDNADLTQLPGQLELIIHDFVTEEAKHMHSARDATDGGSERKIELF